MSQRSSNARRSATGLGRAMVRRLVSAAVAATPAISLLASADLASGQLYWDTNGSGTGATSAGNTAPGTWGASNFWSTNSNGTTATGAWTPGGLAVFSAGANATGTFTVSVSGTQQVSGVTVQEGNVTLDGGEINLASASTSFDILGGTSTITSVITSAPSGNRLVKTGAGTLEVGVSTSQNNLYDGGTTVSGGKLIFPGEPNVTAGSLNPLGVVPGGADPDHIILQNGGILSSMRDDMNTAFLASTRGVTIGAGGGTMDIANANASLNYGGVIAGAARWTKSGPGILRLTSGVNSFTGGFRVTGGILEFGQFETSSPGAGTLRGSGAQPASVVPNWVLLDGGTIRNGNTGSTFVFLATNKGITLTANGGGVSIDNPDSNTFYFGKVSKDPLASSATLYKRGFGEFRANSTNWEQTQLVVEAGLFRVGHETGPVGNDSTLGAVPALFDDDAIYLNGSGGTRTSGGAAIGTFVNITTPANRGIKIGANGGTFVNNATWQINSVISGPGNLHLDGNGWAGSSGGFLILTGANTYGGGTTINRGTLEVRNGNAIPDISAVNFTATGAAASNISLRVTDDETVGSIASGSGFAAMRIELNTGNLTTGANNASTTFGAAIIDGPSGSGNLIKTGTGTLTLTGVNTYGGDTTVNQGKLLVNNAGGPGLGDGVVQVNSGAILGGTGNLDNSNVIINSGGHLAPGASIGTLSVDELTLGGGSVLDYELAAPTTGDRINIEFGLTLSGGTLNITDTGGMDAGTYILLDYGTLDGGSAGNLSLGTTPAGFNYNIIDSGTSIDLLVSTGGGGASKTWNLNENGLWSADANWNTAGEPNGIDHVANFLGVISDNRTVTNDAAHIVGTINFNDNNSYEIGGASTLTMNVSSGSAIINVDGGSHGISAPLALSDNTIVDVIGGSTLTVSKLQNSSVSVTKTGTGKLAVNGVRAAGLSVSAGEVKVLASSNTNLNASRVSSLSISSGATLDLNDSDLIVDGGSYSVIEADVIEGFNGGDWLGNGITSSAAANDTSGVSALGIIDNAEFGYTEFSGQTGLNSDEILVKHTYYGDADVGGTVNNDDFVQFLAGYNEGAPARWLNGDFDYNASVNLDDFALFLAGLQDQDDPRVSPELFANLAEFVASEGIDVDLSTVPEPASAALLALGSLLLARRRRL